MGGYSRGCAGLKEPCVQYSPMEEKTKCRQLRPSRQTWEKMKTLNTLGEYKEKIGVTAAEERLRTKQLGMLDGHYKALVARREENKGKRAHFATRDASKSWRRKVEQRQEC